MILDWVSFKNEVSFIAWFGLSHPEFIINSGNVIIIVASDSIFSFWVLESKTTPLPCSLVVKKFIKEDLVTESRLLPSKSFCSKVLISSSVVSVHVEILESKS